MKYKAFLGQDYEKIKSECLRSGRLFEDDTFPANDSSLYRKNEFAQKIVWKRPYEFLENPTFIIDDIVSNDLDQGSIGNCWAIASFSVVLSIREFRDKIVPRNQTFDKKDYAGIFHFRFWYYGEWVDVCVDDRLPFDSKANRLTFCRNKVEKNEMFASLLEKAYTKLHICYEFMISGDPNDCLIDLTGGVKERFEINRCYAENRGKENFIETNVLWNFIFKSLRYKSFITAWSDSKSKNADLITKNGLAVGHAYSVLNSVEILFKNGSYSELNMPTSNQRISLREQDILKNNSIRLIVLRNPWGYDDSFTGLF
jgi:hypothetical protein